MKVSSSRVLKHPVSRLLTVSLALACSAIAQNYTSPSQPVIGSANTVTAEPSVPRPTTTPCVVQLFNNYTFADFSVKTFSYTPPADCAGPWQKVVLEADFSVTAGRQFDRTANIWIGGANVYFGTTAEPSATVSRSWHIENDLTDYSPLFATSQAGRVELGNLVNSTYTGILYGSAVLKFYPTAKHQEAPRTADVVLPLSANADGGAVTLSSTSSTLSRTFTFPMNVERAYLDVIAQSQSGDEFWWSCAPSDVASELQNCGASGFRETEIAIDGKPAGVAPVYPWIYTGGIDPYLWRPIPGVQTLNFKPYRVDLSPFAGVLSDGQPHTVSLNVFNANGYFATTATLLVYKDPKSDWVSGAVMEDTLSAAPTPNVQENLSTAQNGDITGTVSVTSQRTFRISGYIQTEHGKINTTVDQNISFSNVQAYTITSDVYGQNIKQNTTISSKVLRRGRDGETTVNDSQSWPMEVSYSDTFNADGSITQPTTVKQTYQRQTSTLGGGRPTFTWESNTINNADTLQIGATNTAVNQTGDQRYQYSDSNGACWDRTITAESGVLKTVTGGACDSRK